MGYADNINGYSCLRRLKAIQSVHTVTHASFTISEVWVSGYRYSILDGIRVAIICSSQSWSSQTVGIQFVFVMLLFSAQQVETPLAL